MHWLKHIKRRRNKPPKMFEGFILKKESSLQTAPLRRVWWSKSDRRLHSYRQLEAQQRWNQASCILPGSRQQNRGHRVCRPGEHFFDRCRHVTHRDNACVQHSESATLSNSVSFIRYPLSSFLKRFLGQTLCK